MTGRGQEAYIRELENRAKTLKRVSRKLWELSHIRNLSKFVFDHFFRGLGKIRETFHKISSATEEFSQTSSTILSNTVSVKEEMDSLVKRAEEARDKVVSGSEKVAKLREEVDIYMKGLERVKGSFESIRASVKEINAIVEQTTILALNASIEAARAGELGRGFAVVAEEVRRLAGKTEEFANSIAEKVQTAEKSLREFSEEMEKLKNTMEEIVSTFSEISGFVEGNRELAEKVNGLMSGVVTSVEEQTATAQEIAGNVQDLLKEIETLENQLRVVMRSMERR